MKLKPFFAVAAAMVAPCLLADADIQMVEKEMTHVMVPFVIEGYVPSDRDTLKIERVGESGLRITALKPGRCDIEVQGPMDSVERFCINVGGDLPRMLATLRSELDGVPEVTAEILGGSIRLEGEVKSIRRWGLLEKVLSNPRYAGLVFNYATFSPSDEVLARLKETFEAMGLEVTGIAPSAADLKPGCISMSYRKSTRTLSVYACVYTPAMRERILAALGRERWLSTEPPKDGDFRISADIDIEIAKPRLRIGYAYIVIGEEDIRRLGNRESGEENGGGLIVKPLLGTLVKLIGGMRHDSGKAEVDIGLGAITRFFAEESFTRVSEKAFTAMESWSEDGSRFKSGGTIYVRIASSESVDLKEVPYGFEIKAKGGLVSDEVVSLDLEMEVSSVQAYADGSDIDRKEEWIRQHLDCRLGRTTLIGGFSKMVEGATPASGLPIARNTPILKWFVSDSGNEFTDRRLVMMICPQLDAGDMDEAIPFEELSYAVEDVKVPVEAVLESRKRFKGFWSFLNWFSF